MTLFNHHRPRAPLGSVMLAASLAAVMALNGHAANGVEFDIDDPPTLDYSILPNLNAGARVLLESDYRDDRDLDDSIDDARLTAEPQVEWSLVYAPKEDLQLISEFELAQRFVVDDPDGSRSDDLSLEVKELYLLFREFAPGWSVQAGRQRYRDTREWLYDEQLDGVRVFYRQDDWGLVASVSGEGAAQRDLLNSDDDDRIDYYELRYRKMLNKRSDLDLYLLARDEKSDRGEDLNFVGVQSSGRIDSQHYYWLEAAVVEGDRRGRDILGYGLDLGWTYRFEGEQRYNLTLGFAYGSGDSDGRGTDNNFRQTDLQDNNGRLQGVTKVKYYGEALDPELSNLKIATVGVGMRPSPSSSIDLLYHRYWQVEADDDIRDSTLRVDPDGDVRGLGDGVDLVMAAKLAKDLKASVVLGVFRPGDAFAADADNLWVGELNVSLSF